MSPLTKERFSTPFFYGWVIVGVVALASFIQAAEAYPTLGVLLKPITEEFGWSRSVFTGALTIGTLIGGLIAMAIGPLIDRYGGRWILAIAFAIVGITLTLTSRVNELWQFYMLQIIARASSMGVIMFALQVIIPKWFVTKRGRALAFGQVGLTMGNVVVPFYAQRMVQIAGWRVVTATMGVAMLALSIPLTALLLRRRPEDMGLLPDGVTPNEYVVHYSEPPNVTAPPPPKLEISYSARQVVRMPSFHLLLAASGLLMIIAPGMFLHLISYFTDQNLSPDVAVTVMAVVAGSAAVGSVLFGFIAERYKPRLLLSLSLLLMAGGYVFLLAAHSPFLALTWGFYMGVVQGGVFTMLQIVLADYYGRESIGAIRGIVWPVQSTANAFGPLASAMAYDAHGTYTFVFGLFALLGLIASLCAAWAKPPNSPQSLDAQ